MSSLFPIFEFEKSTGYEGSGYWARRSPALWGKVEGGSGIFSFFLFHEVLFFFKLRVSMRLGDHGIESKKAPLSEGWLG